MTDNYDLRSVKMPRMKGATLKLMTSLVESGATRWLLLPALLKSAGIDSLRGRLFEEPPTYQPPVPPAENPLTDEHNQPALETLDSLPAVSHKGFHFPSARDYAMAYRKQITSPEEVAEQALSAIDTSVMKQPVLNIFTAWDREEVLKQARLSTQRIREGRPLGLLDGVPVCVKEEFDMLPFGSSWGTRFMGKVPVKADASVVKRVRQAGGLMLGKVNMHEVGIGVTGFNRHFGSVCNPYNVNHHTGGSSSGPAAAVAAGFSPLALGADGGGSIRLPAGFCGVVGLKPTFGRVSEVGAAPLCYSVAHNGPIGATAFDAALGYALMGGLDPQDPHTHYQPALTLENMTNFDLSDLTLGVYWPWFRHAAPEVVAACEALLQGFQAMGARLREVEIPDLEPARVAHLVTITSEMNNGLEQYYQPHRKDYSLEVRINLSLSQTFNSRDYVQAQRVRTRLVNSFQKAFADVNVIVTPTSAVPAPPIPMDAMPDGDSDLTLLTEIMRYATPANMTGHPAISFPVGYTRQGLPIGFQAMGRYWEEHVLLRLAQAAETLVERQKPQVFFSLLNG